MVTILNASDEKMILNDGPITYAHNSYTHTGNCFSFFEVREGGPHRQNAPKNASVILKQKKIRSFIFIINRENFFPDSHSNECQVARHLAALHSLHFKIENWQLTGRAILNISCINEYKKTGIGIF